MIQGKQVVWLYSFGTVFLVLYYSLYKIYLLSKSVYGTKYLRVDQIKIFKGCLPQILLGPLLKTFSYLWPSQTSKMEIFCVKIAASYMFNKLLNTTLQSLAEKALNIGEIDVKKEWFFFS